MKRVTPLVCCLSLLACDKEPGKTAPAPSATAAGSARTAPAAAATGGTTPAAAAPGGSAAAAEHKAPCTQVSEKVWATGANPQTGLTAISLADGRVAVGLALGMVPHVLLVGVDGAGDLVRVPVHKDAHFSKPMHATDGRRMLMRVTPSKVEGNKVQAFLDYRDEYKDKWRRVACGPADDDDAWIVFDNVPLLDRDPPPTGEQRAALFKRSEEREADEGYHELRDCRTFVDHRTGSAWIVGSELRAIDQPDGKTQYFASLVVDLGPKQHERHLREIDLKTDTPKQIPAFEVTVSPPLSDGTFLLATRFEGSLVAGILDKNKMIHGRFMSYAGYPTRPEVAPDGDDLVMVTSMLLAKDKGFVLRAMRLGPKPELPKELSPIITGDPDKASEANPSFVRDIKGNRWVGYIEGKDDMRHLELVPVDENFHAVGQATRITNEDEVISEAHVFPVSDGGIVAVYLRETKKGIELISEEVHCDAAAAHSP